MAEEKNENSQLIVEAVQYYLKSMYAVLCPETSIDVLAKIVKLSELATKLGHK